MKLYFEIFEDINEMNSWLEHQNVKIINVESKPDGSYVIWYQD